MKVFKLFALVMLTLVLLSSGAFAVMSESLGSNNVPFVIIDHIEVNSQVASDFAPIYVERGQDVSVAVFFTGNPYGVCTAGNSNPCYNVKVDAELNGYEYGDVRDVQGPFEVEPGVQYRKVLRFKVPDDMPASKDIILNVDIKDENDIVIVRYPIRLQEARHQLNVFDAIFNPTNNVQAGQPLFTSIRLENLGDNVETSIKVTVSIPALGIQTSEYVDRLESLQSDRTNQNVKDSATSNDLMLMIPQNVQEGDYNVLVDLEYNRGRSLEQKAYTMHIKGPQVNQNQNQKTNTNNNNPVTVSVDSEAQKVDQGHGAVFKFSVANLGQQATPYTFELVGASDWSNTKVDPSNLIVQPDSTSDAYVYVAPKEDVTGIKTFTVRVMSGDKLVAEKNLSLEVTQVQKSADLKTVFTWIFAVLLGILVILLVVVLVSKLASRDQKGVEGQTYY